MVKGEKNSEKIIIGLIMLLMLSVAGMVQAFVKVDTQTYKDENGFHAIMPQVADLTNKQTEIYINKLLSEPVTNAWKQFSQRILQNPVAREISFKADYEVAYNQGQILSITLLIYEYTGGAHGSSVLQSTNVMTTNGSSLKLQDLFKSKRNYIDIINKHIKNDIDKRDAKIYTFNAIDNNSPYYLTPNSLVFWLFDVLNGQVIVKWSD